MRGFLLKRFEVGRDGKTSYERLRGKSPKVQGMALVEGFLWKRKRAGGPLGKLTCMWEDGIYLGVKARTAEIIVRESKRCVADENCAERAHQREMGSKQFGNGCGSPLAQKRRRPKDGWRTSQERSGGDGQGVQRKVGGRRACSSPKASAHFT